MPPPGIAGSFFGSGLSAMSVSVVRMSAPIEAVLQGRARHLERLDDAGFEHVDNLAGHRIEAHRRGLALDVVHFDRTFVARVVRDLTKRLFERLAHDVDADLLIGPGRRLTVRLRTRCDVLVDRLNRVHERTAAAGDHAFLHGGAGRGERIFDAMLLLFELRLGCRTDLDDCDAARELREPLLQFLAI